MIALVVLYRNIKVYRTTDDDDSDENSKEECSYLLSTLRDDLMALCY